MSLAAGTRLGPYEILAPLGAGGMGEVYRARDSRLGRSVAIKVLPPGAASDPDRLARFEREARATAALDHPNILGIFDVGTHDGISYLVEQLLEGETLRPRLGAPMPPAKALRIAIQIANGLAAAHEKRIVHRDLKPENIFVTRDGVVKILDFGIAKLVEAAPPGEEETLGTATAGHTAAGLVVGTAGYMAPEQARGQAVDPRSDVFAFGVVLHELLSGERPFRGGSLADTLAAILKEEPPALPASVPAALQRLVARCLEKRPEARYQSSVDLAHDLGAMLTDAGQSAPVSVTIPRRTRRVLSWALAGTLVIAVATAVLVKQRLATSEENRPKRIVVFPFENLGEAEDAYFASGMTDEITNRLANVQGLSVISHTSAVSYSRRGKSTQQIGEDLAVDYVLDGSVRWQRGAGNESRVRITPQLVRVADDSYVWSSRYDRVLADVFAIQSEVAGNAVKAMGVALLPREETALNAVSTTDMGAYDLYLRGLALAYSSKDTSVQEAAAGLFQAALERDPEFTQAFMHLARSNLLVYWYRDRFEGEKASLDAARRAVERLDFQGPDLADTHIARGEYAYFGLSDYPRALREFDLAATLQPGNVEAVYGTASILRRLGRWQEAADRFTKVEELDPRNAFYLDQSGMMSQLLRRYSSADRLYEQSTALSPTNGSGWGRRAWLQILWRGDVGKARDVLTQARTVVSLQDENGLFSYFSFRVALVQRDFPGALRLLDLEKRGELGNQFFFLPVDLLRGQAQALAGHQNEARRSFEFARRRLEELISTRPDADQSHGYHGALGIAYAGLGLRDEALRAGNRGAELMPETKDAWLALARVEDLAVIDTMLGRQDEAIDRLALLLSHASDLSGHALRLDPIWDPLRANPRFQSLLTKTRRPGMTLAAGARLGPYEILGPLGAGGMGEVYRARDPKLKREVAIKVLPEALAKNADALARFEREAFAIGALSHPNILAIHDFGKDRGVSYAVMELLKGRTLRDLLNAGPIVAKQAVALALQIAKGLSAAHEQGIVHRDLKPENLIVGPDGHLKILDFGLAMKTELARSEAETTLSEEILLTKTGAVMGTVPYMSPEQVRGQRVDHRSDLFSFGAILYEILSGSRAFNSDTSAETLSAILRDEPPPLSDSGREISPALINIVRHCLEKNAEQRFQSARDIAFALEELAPQSSVASAPLPRRQSTQLQRWAWPTGILAVVALVFVSLNVFRRDQPNPQQPRAKRIVVLPFENLGAPEEAYFAAGLTEEIIGRLANVRGLAVISRTTAVAYDRKGKTVRQIGADLRVDYVLEGTVRSEHVAGKSSRLRISPQLIQVSDDTNVWAERYDRVLAEVIVIQSEVAESVVKAMGVKLLPREETALRAVATRDIEAYDLYLRGREISSRGQTRENLEGAIRAYQSAVDRDPHFSEALAQLTRAHLYLYFVSDPSQEHVQRAREAIDRLASIDPRLPETHLARGYYAYWVDLDYPRALREFEEVVALQPSNADPLEGISYVLRRQGRFSESTDQIARWLDLDPRNSLALFQFGLSGTLAGRYEEAERAYTLSTAINPKFGIPWANRGLLQITWKGDVAGAESVAC